MWGVRCFIFLTFLVVCSETDFLKECFMRSGRRPLDPSEVSWILEGKIRGTIPIRLFPRPCEDPPDQEICTVLPADDPPPREVNNAVSTETAHSEKLVTYSR
jgi:hypothetical protein